MSIFVQLSGLRPKGAKREAPGGRMSLALQGLSSLFRGKAERAGPITLTLGASHHRPLPRSGRGVL
jgi:hypothetical protein